MARLNVNPTRMELNGLREKLQIAKHGHKLLKDKQDALTRDFAALAYRAKNLRKEIETELAKINNSFILSSEVTDEDTLLMNLSYGQEDMRAHVQSRRMLNLRVPRFDIHVPEEGPPPAESLYPYSFQSASTDMDEAAMHLKELLPKIIKLAQYDKSCQLLSEEIKATRRRVNALEFRTIADIEETIAYILMRIDENERNNTARLMKIVEE